MCFIPLNNDRWVFQKIQSDTFQGDKAHAPHGLMGLLSFQQVKRIRTAYLNDQSYIDRTGAQEIQD